MKRIFIILVAALLSAGTSHANRPAGEAPLTAQVPHPSCTGTPQKLTDSGYRTVGHIKSDGTVQDSSYRTIGHICSDGKIQDSSYHTIGHARDIQLQWAALFFFFKL